MAETQYDPVVWSDDDIITPSKLQKMSSNLDYVNSKRPDIAITYGPIANRQQGLKILCGMAPINAPNEKFASFTVNFAGWFTAGCRPCITTGIYSENRRVHTTIRGLVDLQPDEKGFKVIVASDLPNEATNVLGGRIYIPWTAFGY